jgi:hypothetical protein
MKKTLFAAILCIITIAVSAQTSTCAANLSMICDQKKSVQSSIELRNQQIESYKKQIQLFELQNKVDNQTLCSLDGKEKDLLICVSNENANKKVLQLELDLDAMFQKMKQRISETKTTQIPIIPCVNCK